MNERPKPEKPSASRAQTGLKPATLVVIIASLGRPAVLAETVGHLERQTRKPDLVILSLVEEDDAPRGSCFSFEMRTVFGPKGLARQRNTGMDAALPGADIITFFDDDFVPADNYLARVEEAFALHPDYAAIHGNVVADGIGGTGLSFDDACRELEAARGLSESEAPTIRRDATTYGCNMSFRMNKSTDWMRFDERLELYAWQEDRDFSFRVGQTGSVMWMSNIVGVHLGTKGGRVNGLRMGYSQIVNPVYLMRKGTMPVADAVRLMSRNILANVAKSFHPEPWVDRKGRLKGNIIGFSHVVLGRIEPERVLELSSATASADPTSFDDQKMKEVGR
ncbi:MAG: glycosyltransferase family 2 protein [Hyphomicrobiaceae bacterium]